MLNMPIWNAEKGVGSFLTFDMGEKILKILPNGDPYYRGIIHLWIYLCKWEILIDGKLVLDGDASDEDIKASMKYFLTKKLFQ